MNEVTHDWLMLMQNTASIVYICRGHVRFEHAILFLEWRKTAVMAVTTLSRKLSCNTR